MSIEKKSKISRLITVVLAIFFLSFLYSLIDNYPNYNSAFDFGKSTGEMFGHMLKILGMIILMALTFRCFKSVLLK